MMPTALTGSTPTGLQVEGWRAIPLADPALTPACRWAIVAGDVPDESGLFVEISGCERPDQVAEFLLAAARAHQARAVASLQAEADAVRAELGRVDVKATALLSTAGTMFAVLSAAVTVQVPLPLALAAVVLGAVFLAAAIVMLLVVIRPALPRRHQGGTGFVAHAEATGPSELVTALTADPETRLATEVLRLSHLARRKYLRLRRGVHLLLSALAVLVVALPLGVLA